jgi:NitT/TauT family transport system substrate-binding protein
MRVLVLIALLVGCSGHGADPRRVSLALNWFPETEHGGYFAALVQGDYAERKVTVDIRPGGPNVPVVPRVASREVDFGVVNADDVVAARAAGAKVVALMAPIHHSPVCIMVHASTGITRLADLHDVTLAMQAGTPYVAWLERTAKLPNVQLIPYAGSVAPFLTNERYAQQAYVFSEPIIAKAKGTDPRCLSITETGFDPYTSVLVTSEALLRERSDLVGDVVAASAHGWERYVEDFGPAHAHILTLNPEIGREALDRGAEALRPLVLDDAAERDGVATMEPARWTAVVEQMRTVGAIDAKIDPATIYDARFVPRRTP